MTENASNSRRPSVFRPRARILTLLGDQLIRDEGLAVFELVKNAYDADAKLCKVIMHNIDDPETARITVEDNGCGMDRTRITSVWLEPGTDFRADERARSVRTPLFKRLPLGEKGVGRFAAHKLGNAITLTTRPPGGKELVVSIDWTAFETHRYLEDVPVAIRSRSIPKVFKGSRHGTLIEISQLRNKWTRAKVRDLQRSTVSICSPFKEPSSFIASLQLRPQLDWLDGLTDIHTVLDSSLFQGTGTIQGNEVTYQYEFTPHANMIKKIKGRSVSQSVRITRRNSDGKSEALDLSNWKIGPINFTFHMFDREPAVLDLVTADKTGLKRFLDQNGGIRVYRDGIRIFDFGEPGNDWLELGGRRVNIPSARVSNNQLIGAASLNRELSDDLVEKTNREGFLEGDAYDAFRDAVLFALTQIEVERRIDKVRLRSFYHRDSKRESVIDEINQLRQELEKRHLAKELGHFVDRIEKDFINIRDRMVSAAGAGLALAMAVHEVEKIIKGISAALKQNAKLDVIRDQFNELSTVVEGLSFLLRKSGKSTEKASTLIKQALFNVSFRLKAHRIDAVDGIESGICPDFQINCTRRLIIASLMNLIDNSIYWIESKGDVKRKIYLGTYLTGKTTGGLTIADTGPGFIDDPEMLTEPFVSRKPDGMGLGLHLANEVAKIHGGQLLFPSGTDIGIPRQFAGAVVAMEMEIRP